MSSRALLVLSVFAVSCGDGPIIETGSAPYRVHDQAKSMLLTQARVESHYETDLGRAWEEADVRWTATRCPYHLDDYAVVYRDRCYYGIMFGCESIYVALSNWDEKRTCGSALTHEFGHCLRGLMGLGWTPCPGMDAPHKDKEFWGVIKESKEESCARGW